MIRSAGVSDAPNRPPQSPAPAFRFGNRILCISDGALVFSGCMPELSRGFALHLTVPILGNCCGTWPENAPKPENRFKRATNIAGLSFSDHCCIRLDQAVILDPGWPKMAQGIRNGTHFSARHGVQLQDGGRGGGVEVFRFGVAMWHSKCGGGLWSSFSCCQIRLGAATTHAHACMRACACAVSGSDTPKSSGSRCCHIGGQKIS